MASAAGPTFTTRSSAVQLPDFVINGDKFLQWDDVSSYKSFTYLCVVYLNLMQGTDKNDVL